MGAPSAMIGRPLTSTQRMPTASWRGSSHVERAATVAASNTARSAAAPARITPRSGTRKRSAGKPAIL